MGDEPQFVEKVKDDLMCPICHMLLQDPQQTNCGHEFCRKCVRPLMRGGTLTCPICRAGSIQNQIFDDKRLKREIMDLKINCDQSGKGCKWTGELRQREKHNDDCGYVTKPCVNNCGQFVMRKDMENHRSKDCDMKIVSCEHCKAESKFALLKLHYLECKKYPVQCVHKCGMTVAKEDMKKHTSLQGTCPNSPLDCEFRDIGCDFRGKRQQLNKHIETGSPRHFRLVLAEMRGIKRKLTVVEKELSEESEQRKLVMPPGQFIYMWKIDKWQQKVDKEEEEENFLKSNAFYVDPGYHMFIKAYPCSQALSSDGDHLGLFLCPTTGDFDAHMNWPFSKSFTLTVVDQQRNGQNISNTASPPFESRSAAGGHSFAGPNSNGWGCLLFTTHEKLKTRCYIKDDAVLMKLSVQL